MIRTIIFFLYFWLFLIFSLFIYGFYLAIKLINPDLGNKILLILVKWWARNVLRIGGIKVNLMGAENIPKNKDVCFVSNHQSNFDIVVTVVSLPMIFGFIAKYELKKFLPLRVWMDEISCLFINRSKPKDAIRVVKERIEYIKNHKPLLIFPEGKRSRNKNMIEFKTGSLKLLIEQGIEIVPITIKNSYLRYEVNNKITPGIIDVVVHESIKTMDLQDLEIDLIIDKIYKTIEAGLVA